MTVSTCQALGLQNACYAPNNSAELDFSDLSPEVAQAAQNLNPEEVRDIQWLSGLPQTGELDQATLEGFVNLLENGCVVEDGCEDEEVEMNPVQLSKDELYRDNPTTIRAQKQLNKIYEGDMPPLKVDGIRGPGTTARIKMFQQAAGLEQTGKLDAPTRDTLYNKVSFVSMDAEPVVAEKQEPAAPRKSAWVGTTDATQEEKSLLRKLVENIDTSQHGAWQTVTNFAAGLGDKASFNLTDYARANFGGNESVNKNTGSYSGGEAVGTVLRDGVLTAATGGLGPVVSAADKVKNVVKMGAAAEALSFGVGHLADRVDK